MRRSFVVLAVALAPVAARATPLAAGAFVRVAGAEFVVDGRPFAFVGANFEAVQGEGFRARYQDTIAALSRDGLRVGRVWAFGEGPADASDWYRRDHLFRAGPDGWIEASYQHLDRVLAAARAAGVRLIVTLGNQWGNYGGIPAYLRWAGLPDDDPTPFYRDPRLRAWYRDGVERLLQRTNTVTGVRYLDDPTIFAWELLNESTVDDAALADARYAWIDELSGFLKRADPNHLVAAGTIGYSSRLERSDWIRVHRLPGIDYCDSHLYPHESTPEGQVPPWQRLADLVDDRAQLARHVVGKPLVIGEFGFRTDGPAGRPWRGLPRAAWVRRFLARLRDDGVAGALAWIYQPFVGKPRDFGIYVDRPRTDDIRGALAESARLLASLPRLAPQNPRLDPAWGDAPLYQQVVAVRGRPARARRWARRSDGAMVLAIRPGEFESARFERAGYWDKTALEHVYGRGPGQIDYRFRAPPATSGGVELRVRLSSEWPGVAAPPSGGSLCEVLLDGERVAVFDVVPDDGKGSIHAIRVSDPRLVRRLAAGSHRLTFRVPEGPRANGVCVYGLATHPAAAPPVEEPIPIQIVYLPAPPSRARLRAEAP